MAQSLKRYGGTYADSNRIALWGLVKPSDSKYLHVEKEERFDKANNSPVLIYDSRLSEIQKKLNNLEKIVSDLTDKINEYKPTVIELKEISHAEAKQEIIEYFKAHHGESVYSYQITEALKIEMDLVEEILEELEKERQIKGVNPRD
jgi:lipoate-protein ligase A